MLTYLPAILHRLDGNMIAYDLYCLIGLPVDPVLFLQAITSGNTQDSLIEFLEPLSNVTQPASGAIFPRYDPHNPDDVRKLNTLPFNYERLEFLGDTLIKYYVTAYLIADSCKNPNSPLLREEDITKRKTKIIRNDNLAELADSVSHSIPRTKHTKKIETRNLNQSVTRATCSQEVSHIIPW